MICGRRYLHTIMWVGSCCGLHRSALRWSPIHYGQASGLTATYQATKHFKPQSDRLKTSFIKPPAFKQSCSQLAAFIPATSNSLNQNVSELASWSFNGFGIFPIFQGWRGDLRGRISVCVEDFQIWWRPKIETANVWEIIVSWQHLDHRVRRHWSLGTSWCWQGGNSRIAQSHFRREQCALGQLWTLRLPETSRDSAWLQRFYELLTRHFATFRGRCGRLSSCVWMGMPISRGQTLRAQRETQPVFIQWGWMNMNRKGHSCLLGWLFLCPITRWFAPLFFHCLCYLSVHPHICICILPYMYILAIDERLRII